jgi:hypothetical protein
MISLNSTIKEALGAGKLREGKAAMSRFHDGDGI